MGSFKETLTDYVMWIVIHLMIIWSKISSKFFAPHVIKDKILYANGGRPVVFADIKTNLGTVFENHRKSLIQHCELQSYVYILSGQKLSKNAKNGPFWRVFEKPEACGQIVLPDRSVLIGQKLLENTKM